MTPLVRGQSFAMCLVHRPISPPVESFTLSLHFLGQRQLRLAQPIRDGSLVHHYSKGHSPGCRVMGVLEPDYQRALS